MLLLSLLISQNKNTVQGLTQTLLQKVASWPLLGLGKQLSFPPFIPVILRELSFFLIKGYPNKTGLDVRSRTLEDYIIALLYNNNM